MLCSLHRRLNIITIRELLAQAAFTNLHVLTNDHTLDRHVETVDLTETPDVAHFTTTEALLLTTAMAFKDDSDALIPFIQSLVDVEVAGLAIKVNRFLKQIDPKVIDFANKNNFPIIEIPADVTLGIISHNMLDFILGKQTQQMLYALEIQKHYSNLFIDGASPQQILDELSMTIKTPIALITPFMREIAHSSFFNATFNPVNFYVDQIRQEMTQREDKVIALTIFNSKGEETYVNIYPIKVNSSYPYYLIVLHPNKLSYPIEHFAIDQGIMVLSFILYKNNQIESSMIAVQNSFFNKLLFGQHPIDRKDPEFFEQGLNYGLISTNFYQVILCDVQQKKSGSLLDEETGELIYQWLIEKVLPKLKYGLLFYHDKTHVSSILLQHPVPELENLLESSAQELIDLLGIRIHFGLGKPVSHAYEIRNSYFESLKAMEEQTDKYIKHYNPSGLLTLFKGDNEEAIVYFIKQHLKDLAFSKDPFTLELITTLKAYLDNQSEISKTADSLFLHRNTISYRIKKCEEILDVDFKEASVSLNLRIALELLELMS